MLCMEVAEEDMEVQEETVHLQLCFSFLKIWVKSLGPTFILTDEFFTSTSHQVFKSVSTNLAQRFHYSPLGFGYFLLHPYIFLSAPLHS